MNDQVLIEYGHDDDHGEEEIDDFKEDGPACIHGCFGLFGFSSKQNSNDTEPVYLFRKLHEAREFAKVFGGPKGKNLVSKIATCCKWCRKQKIGLWKKKKKNKFRYDAHSYALNFDASGIGEGEALDFTARYADPSNGEHYSVVQ